MSHGIRLANYFLSIFGDISMFKRAAELTKIEKEQQKSERQDRVLSRAKNNEKSASSESENSETEELENSGCAAETSQNNIAEMAEQQLAQLTQQLAQLTQCIDTLALQVPAQAAAPLLPPLPLPLCLFRPR